jgi:hypothetical protein
MGHDDAIDEPAPPRDSVDRFYDAVGGATRFTLRGMGLAAMGLGLVARRVRSRPATRAGAEPDPPPAGDRSAADSAEVVALGAVAVGAEISRRVFTGAAWAASQAERGTTALIQHRPLRGPVERLTSSAEPWDERARQAAGDGGRAAADRGLDLAAEIATRIVDRVDIDAIVDRVDIERVLSRVDLNEIAGRLDVDAVAARLDLERVIGRLDLAAVAQGVIDQLDLAAIAQRVIDQLDLAAIAEGVINELELSEIIRESTGTVTVDAVDALRVGGMQADRLVTRVVDRLLMRREGSGDDDASRPSDPAPSPSGGAAST